MKTTDIGRMYFHLTGNFIFNIFAHLIALIILLVIGNNLASFIKIAIFLPLTAVPLILALIVFHVYAGKLQSLIDNKKTDKESLKYASKIPLIASVILVPLLLLNSVFLPAVYYYQHVLYTLTQVVFFVILGIFMGMAASLYHYYKIKIIMYPLKGIIRLESLSIFEKLLTPVFIFIVSVFLVVAITVYSVSVNITIDNYKSTAALKGDKIVETIDSRFRSVQEELNSYLNVISPSRVSPKEAFNYVTTLFDKRVNRQIELLFIVKNTGICFTNQGTSYDISDRDYIKYGMKYAKPKWSDLITSKATGRQVIACVVPEVINGKMEGGFCAAMNADNIQEIILKASTEKDIMFLMGENGRIIYHKEKKWINQILGKDILDGQGRDLSAFVKSEGTDYEEYMVEGKPLLYKKSRIATTGHYIVSRIYLRDLMEPVDTIISRIIIGLLLVVGLVIIIIYSIGRNFSAPIRDTIRIFKNLSEGDLTVKTKNNLSDELGDMLKNLNEFQNKIREVVDTALNSSGQLAASAEQLATTSSVMAQSAQSGAAAVEEATASLEEISASNESIANNSKLQSERSKDTNRAMEELGQIIKAVHSDSTDALKVANITSEEARKGNDLMKNTITGMNDIENNSNNIAQMVMLISDISDQVNLLALNAAIEAARAGEYGRGFAVVADEIGKLAEQTADSAKNITGLVSAGVKSAKQGIKDIGDTSKAMENIINYVNQTKEFVQKIVDSAGIQAKSSEIVLKATKEVMEMSNSISGSTNEQNLTHEEISKTMNQINEQTQQQASGAHEIAASAEEISAQAESLKRLLEFFKI
jgi:methyl-accepting chemotaxis protein